MARAAKAKPKRTRKAAAVAPVKRGPGRPRKPAPPLSPLGQLEANAVAELLVAEGERSAATAAYRLAPTMAGKVVMLESEMRCAQAHGARCRAAGNYTHALKFGELLAKFASQHATAMDQLGLDRLADLERKKKREAAAASRGNG